MLLLAVVLSGPGIPAKRPRTGALQTEQANSDIGSLRADPDIDSLYCSRNSSYHDCFHHAWCSAFVEGQVCNVHGCKEDMRRCSWFKSHDDPDGGLPTALILSDRLRYTHFGTMRGACARQVTVTVPGGHDEANDVL